MNYLFECVRHLAFVHMEIYSSFLFLFLFFLLSFFLFIFLFYFFMQTKTFIAHVKSHHLVMAHNRIGAFFRSKLLVSLLSAKTE